MEILLHKNFPFLFLGKVNAYAPLIFKDGAIY